METDEQVQRTLEVIDVNSLVETRLEVSHEGRRSISPVCHCIDIQCLRISNRIMLRAINVTEHRFLNNAMLEATTEAGAW